MIEKCVDGAEGRQGLCHGCIHRRLVGDIRADAHGVAARLYDAFGQLARRAFIAIDDGDPCALGCEQERGRFSAPARSARNKRRLARKAALAGG